MSEGQRCKKADNLKRAFAEKAVATDQTNFGFQERVLKCQKCWVIVCFHMKNLRRTGPSISSAHIVLLFNQ